MGEKAGQRGRAILRMEQRWFQVAKHVVRAVVVVSLNNRREREGESPHKEEYSTYARQEAVVQDSGPLDSVF